MLYDQNVRAFWPNVEFKLGQIHRGTRMFFFQKREVACTGSTNTWPFQVTPCNFDDIFCSRKKKDFRLCFKIFYTRLPAGMLLVFHEGRIILKSYMAGLLTSVYIFVS